MGVGLLLSSLLSILGIFFIVGSIIFIIYLLCCGIKKKKIGTNKNFMIIGQNTPEGLRMSEIGSDNKRDNKREKERES